MSSSAVRSGISTGSPSLYLAPVDVRAIMPARGERKLTEFFGRWTAKEAYTKALGRGLSTPLESFDLPSPVDGVAWFTAGGRGWTLLAIRALARLHGGGRRLRAAASDCTPPSGWAMASSPH